MTESTTHRLIAYVVVVLASWGGQVFIADHAADTAAQVSYENQLDACIRANKTIRTPLHTFATVRLVDDAVSYDERLALQTLADKSIQVDCVAVLDQS
jgi:hypothetical protein